MITTLTSKGQLTLPADIRRQLNLKPGDKLDFTLLDDGRVEVTPVRGSMRDLKGSLPRPKRTVSLKQMDQAIRQGARR